MWASLHYLWMREREREKEREREGEREKERREVWRGERSSGKLNRNLEQAHIWHL